MAEVIESATGIDLRAELKMFVDGTKELPVEVLLAQAGIALHAVAGSASATLAARMRAANGALAIATVRERGAAHRAGLAAGDVVVAVDGWRIDTQAALDAVLARLRPKATVKVHAFRLDALITFDVCLDVAPPEAWRLSRHP